MLAVVIGDHLVRMDFFPGKTVDAVLNEVPVAQVILPPQQARSWSEFLQQMQLHSETEISSDRQWSAQTTIALPAVGGKQYYRRLIVANKDSSLAYTLADEWSPFGLGYTAPRPLAWFGMSAIDRPVLYWSNVPVIDGCQTFTNGSDLHRLDLLTGVGQTLLSKAGSWLVVSPDQSRAAVIDGRGLGIYDLSNGQARFTDLPDGKAGQVIWSPDGREVALTIADDDGSGSVCLPAQATTHTILVIEAETLDVKLALRQDPRQLNTQSWSQLGLIKLIDGEAKPFLLDPLTGGVWDALAERPVGTPNAPMQIRFFANLYEEDVTALRKLAAQFTVENPGMRVVFTDYPEISTYANNSLEDTQAAILSENDCLVDWTMPNEFNRRNEILQDLRPMITLAGAELSQDYWPEQLDGYTLEGKLYGLPMFERPSMIHYNADLLAQKGIPAPSPDWTFNDFINLLTKLADSNAGEKIYGFPSDAGSLGQFAEGLFAPVFDTGSSPPAANFISPEMAAGLERLAELRRTGAIVYLPATLFAGQDYYDIADAWVSGRVAFWQIPYPESTPFPAAEREPEFRTGVLPLPAHGPFFRNGYSVQQSFYIGKDSLQAAGCMAWYRFVVSHPEASNSAPARRSMIENPTWRARSW